MTAPGDFPPPEFVHESRPSSSEEMVSGSVVDIDMVGYSDVAKLLEQNTSAGSVAGLNRQIQGLISHSLSDLPSEADYCFVGRTGDGAILIFKRADDAHVFSEALHLRAKDHNDRRTVLSAKRWFRIGIATGPVSKTSCHGGHDEYAGITIANAVRLQAAGQPGEIVVDIDSFSALSPDHQSLYGPEETVAGKRQEIFAVHKYLVLSSPAANPATPVKRMTRRRLVVSMTSFFGLAALGTYGSLSYIEDWLHPLPKRRFIALMAWPEAAKEAQPIVAAALSTIGNSLVRAESHTADLLVLSTSDLDTMSNAPGQSLAGRRPSDIANLLGANLILAAHSQMSTRDTTLSLKVIDVLTSQVLRDRQFTLGRQELATLTDRAVAVAAQMLHLPNREIPLSDDDELKQAPPKVSNAYIEGRNALDAPNESGLDAAVAHFLEALKDSPNFAAGYAGLALAYIARYERYSRDADLELASKSATRALELNPNSVSGLLAQAQTDTDSGRSSEALDHITRALKLDPQNSDLLLYEARVYGDVGDATSEERVYRQLIKLRPFYWKAYNDLGVLLREQKDYNESRDAFAQASALASHASVPLANLGMLYLLLDDEEAASSSFRRALDLAPDEVAYNGLGNIAYGHTKYAEALELYRKASEVNPANISSYRNMADCLSMLGRNGEVKENYAKAAAIQLSKLTNNPKPGSDWARLAFYDAKSGNSSRAIADLKEAEQRGANDRYSDFYKAQALAVLGRYEQAFDLVSKCIDRGTSPMEVTFAVDLRQIASDPRYLAHIKKLSRAPRKDS